MRIHQADFPTEECCAFRALKECLRAAVVGHRPIEEANAIWRAQMFADEPQVLARLGGREQVFDNRVNHGERAVVHACDLVPRMQQVAHTIDAFEEGVTGEHAIDHQQAVKISIDCFALDLEARGVFVAADGAKGVCEQRERLEVQRHRPGTAQALAHRRVRGL